MKIENLSVLKAAEYNPRKISQAALDGLKYSLQEFGDISGIVFNQRTGRLVAGHQRVKALIDKFGDLQISGDLIETPAGVFKIRVVDWDEDKEKAANIAANAESIQGQWTEHATMLVEAIAINLPHTFDALNLNSIKTPAFSLPVESIEVERQTSEISQKQRNLMKFGDVTIYLSDTELENLSCVYQRYIEQTRNNYGFITYLIEGR